MDHKRSIYIFFFVILGILLSFLAHALIEIWYIRKLLADFEKWSLGLSWDQWYVIHYVGSVVLLILGVVFGWQQGQYWWRVIYLEKKFGTFKGFLNRWWF